MFAVTLVALISYFPVGLRTSFRWPHDAMEGSSARRPIGPTDGGRNPLGILHATVVCMWTVLRLRGVGDQKPIAVLESVSTGLRPIGGEPVEEHLAHTVFPTVLDRASPRASLQHRPARGFSVRILYDNGRLPAVHQSQPCRLQRRFRHARR